GSFYGTRFGKRSLGSPVGFGLSDLPPYDEDEISKLQHFLDEDEAVRFSPKAPLLFNSMAKSKKNTDGRFFTSRFGKRSTGKPVDAKESESLPESNAKPLQSQEQILQSSLRWISPFAIRGMICRPFQVETKAMFLCRKAGSESDS
ncbi:unnamed protein product, partial [Cyprideis torosa]